MRKFFLAIACAISTIILQATPQHSYMFRMLDISSGLPDNNVRNMLMLPNGLICIQTPLMINLFDGTSCQSYKYDATKIPYTEYNGLYESYYDAQENVIWCTTRDHIWVFDLSDRTFEYDVTERLRRHGMSSSEAESLYIDSEGKFWIFTSCNEISICDKGRSSTVMLPEGMSLPVVIRQHKDRMWMLSMNGKLAEFDMKLGSFRTVKTIPVDSGRGSVSRMEMDITTEGDIWIMFDKDLIHYDRQGQFESIARVQPESKDLFTTIALDNNDNLWVGTARSGVSIIRKESKKPETLPYLEMTDGNRVYHHTDIAKIVIDPLDGVWIATQAEGLLYWHEDIIRIEAINNRSISKGDMNDESVKCMLETDGGKILIGTIHGLLEYDPVTNRIRAPYSRLKDELCISLFQDSRSRIWVGTFYNGAYCIHDNGSITHYKYQDVSVDMSYHESMPNFNCVRSFFEDSRNMFWISVYGGAGRFDPQTGYISLLRDEHPELERFMIVRDICETPDGSLLITGDNGNYLYNPEDSLVISSTMEQESHMQMNHTIFDRKGLMWTATAEGLHVTDFKKGTRYLINEDNGLPAGNIMSVTSDDMGNIWAASFSSISRIRTIPSEDGRIEFAVSTFGKEAGVEPGAFFQKSVLKHSGGNIYFGSAHGIYEIVPEKLMQDKSELRPLITSVQVADKTLQTWENPMTLKHNETFLTFCFSNMNYANPSNTKYMYMLENFDNEWRTSSTGMAQYTYLNPGRYRFKVKASDNDVDWGEITSIDITIRPPVYRSIVAYIVYMMLFLAGGIALTIWQQRQTRRKIQENKEKEKQRQKENLDQMKFRFFTNISHELRTPLSLIMLPLESVMKELKGSAYEGKLQTMHHNASQLLSLVNHLLDFRKLEMGGEKINLKTGNISEFVGSIILSFRDAAQKSNITISFENIIEKPMMVFDNIQMQKVVNNLLSNALKFTPEGGFINVKVSQDGGRYMILEVSDTGIGIPAKDMINIFNRFYRSGNTELRTGSGIGLSLVKQYVEMHSGSISVSSEVGKGSTFTVRIPMNLAPEGHEENASAATPAVRNPLEHSGQTNIDDDRHRHIMIVDDNPDFREYLVSELSGQYEVTAAADGAECLEILKKVNPEVIICDVMMPVMDGFEVVKAIKNNIETSHIPVILLSARTSEDIRLEGYETGADAYLTKPFKLDMLLARVRNLIEERSRRIARFSKGADISPAEVTITTIDQKLMTKIMECIENNMDNSEYSVEELSHDIGMHRMNLYRKLQSITGMTPSEFIRTMRLKRAAQLLQSDPNLSVSEVSDMVGFNTQKYFTKYFKEMFGVIPSQYR